MTNSGISDPGECSNPQIPLSSLKDRISRHFGENCHVEHQLFKEHNPGFLPDMTISFQHLVHVSHPQCCSGYPSSEMWLRTNTQEHYSTVTQLMSMKRSCGSAGGTVLPPS